MQETGFFTKIIFAVFLFQVSAWLFNHAVCKIGLRLFSITCKYMCVDKPRRYSYIYFAFLLPDGIRQEPVYFILS
jgi:hypothetical protein